MTAEKLEVFDTAARNQMIHAIALILVGLACRANGSSPCTQIAGVGVSAGHCSVLRLAVCQRAVGQCGVAVVAPLGGIAFVVGWIALAVAAWRWPAVSPITRETASEFATCRVSKFACGFALSIAPPRGPSAPSSRRATATMPFADCASTATGNTANRPRRRANRFASARRYSRGQSDLSAQRQSVEQLQAGRRAGIR